MIANERSYQVTAEAIAMLEAALVRMDREPVHPQVRMYELMRGALQTELELLRQQAARHSMSEVGTRFRSHESVAAAGGRRAASDREDVELALTAIIIQLIDEAWSDTTRHTRLASRVLA